MPVGDILVRDARRHVKHNDAALAVDVVPVAKTAKLFLPGRVPDVKDDIAKVLRRVSTTIRGYSVQQTPLAGGLVGALTVEKPSGWTSTPSVAMYFFSNSPVKWRLTKVVCKSGREQRVSLVRPGCGNIEREDERIEDSRLSTTRQERDRAGLSPCRSCNRAFQAASASV